MAKRFTDSLKYKKPFIRSLPGPYKLLFDYLYHDCDHAGVWIVDFDIAQIYLGKDMVVDHKEALSLFKEKIIEVDNGTKWFIPSFIEFQYGNLNPQNRAHLSVINILKKYDVIEIIEENEEGASKVLIRPLQGCKDKDKDMDKDMDMVKDKEVAKSEEINPCDEFVKYWNSIPGIPTRSFKSSSIKSKTYKKIKDRLKSFKHEDVEKFFISVQESKHIFSEKWFTLDFCVKSDENFEKVINKWMEWKKKKEEKPFYSVLFEQKEDKRQVDILSEFGETP